MIIKNEVCSWGVASLESSATKSWACLIKVVVTYNNWIPHFHTYCMMHTKSNRCQYWHNDSESLYFYISYSCCIMTWGAAHTHTHTHTHNHNLLLSLSLTHMPMLKPVMLYELLKVSSATSHVIRYIMHKYNANDSDRYFCQIQSLRIICLPQVPGITLACCWSPAPLTRSVSCCWRTTWPPLSCWRRSARGWTWLCPTTRPSLLLSSAWLSPRGRRGSLERAWNDASLCTLLTLPGMLQWMGSMIGWLGLLVSLPLCSGGNCLGHFVWQCLVDLCFFSFCPVK